MSLGLLLIIILVIFLLGGFSGRFGGYGYGFGHGGVVSSHPDHARRIASYGPDLTCQCLPREHCLKSSSWKSNWQAFLRYPSAPRGRNQILDLSCDSSSRSNASAMRAK